MTLKNLRTGRDRIMALVALMRSHGLIKQPSFQGSGPLLLDFFQRACVSPDVELLNLPVTVVAQRQQLPAPAAILKSVCRGYTEAEDLLDQLTALIPGSPEQRC